MYRTLEEWEELAIGFPDPTESVESFVENTRLTLQYWLDIHTKAKWWAASWVLNESPLYFLKESIAHGKSKKAKGVIGNDYFTFDWREAAVRSWARANRESFLRCVRCGSIYERYYEPERCDACNGKTYRTPSLPNLIYWCQDIFYEDLPDGVDDDVAWDALWREGFTAYYAALEPVFRGAAQEVKDALKDYKRCRSNAERLMWALWAMHIQHVHGTIFKDYGGGQNSYEMVDIVQQEGLTSYFDQELIDEYVAQG